MDETTSVIISSKDNPDVSYLRSLNALAGFTKEPILSYGEKREDYYGDGLSFNVMNCFLKEALQQLEYSNVIFKPDSLKALAEKYLSKVKRREWIDIYIHRFGIDFTITQTTELNHNVSVTCYNLQDEYRHALFHGLRSVLPEIDNEEIKCEIEITNVECSDNNVQVELYSWLARKTIAGYFRVKEITPNVYFDASTQCYQYI